MLSLIEELKYDISYNSRKALIYFDNDATSRYDQILPNVSSLIARKKGMSQDVIFVHANTLEEANIDLKLHWASVIAITLTVNCSQYMEVANEQQTCHTYG
eukprot:3469395-Ditylum_brightwellii.AAC.1